MIIFALLSISCLRTLLSSHSNYYWGSDHMANTFWGKIDLSEILHLNSTFSKQTAGSFCEKEEDENKLKHARIKASKEQHPVIAETDSKKYGRGNYPLIINRLYGNLPWPFT